MFINPQTAIQQGWIKGVKDPAKQVQPNAVDFTLDTLKWVRRNEATVSEDVKVMRHLDDMSADADGLWYLDGGEVYDGTSDVYVEVPAGYAAILYTRSTFARNGIFIVSGLYDSGYKGHIGFTIYTVGGPVKIAPGTRIGQIALVAAQSAGMYAGGYNHIAGTHYAQTTPATATSSTVMPNNFTFVDPPVAGSSFQLPGTNVGQKQINSDPRRTETGMGPILGNDSEFI